MTSDQTEKFDKAAWLMNNALALLKESVGTPIRDQAEEVAREMAKQAVELAKGSKQ